MELPKRKPIRLKEFNYSNCICFITLCAKDRKSVFGTFVGDDDHIVPTRIGEVTEKYLLQIPGLKKYTMMPNHIHLLLETEGRTPSTRIKTMKTLVTKEIGVSVFQRSFYDHVVRNEQDYWSIWKYMDENPAKWQLDRFYIHP